MVKRFIISILGLFLFCFLQAQEFSNIRIRLVEANADTIVLDTLSIIPKTVVVKSDKGVLVNPLLYEINHGASKLILNPVLKDKGGFLNVYYRVFPTLFEKDYSFRDYQGHLSPDSLLGRDPPRTVLGRVQEPLFGDDIQTSGSIMRGIRFGNNQDLSVNSSMNITFAGELESGLMIEGAISDQSVPLQPDGTTRRLEEFDRVYIKVHRDDFAVQAGDIDLRKGGEGKLLTFSRNVQGLAYKGSFADEKDTLIVETAFAVPKGKFVRNQIQGSEGNQGPYRLKGSGGEPFIIVISGSERVYVDGVLLVRGEDQHYTIDYNAAEVNFTHRMPINRNSRISVEFEYSERSYARFNTFANVQGKRESWQWHLSAFSEQDSRNQPFDQELTDEQKQHLASIGDSLHLAFFPQADRVEFDPEKILYQKLDTLVSGETHTIYQHSTNPNHLHYRVYFTFVGQGNGNYQPDFGTANGRVYRWVAPENGMQQGSYEPVRRLVPPQKRQMVHTGFSKNWGEGSHLSANYALSNTDINTFSSLNSDDNIGHAFDVGLSQRFTLPDTITQIGFGGDFIITTDGFRPIDRFRSLEFERDWSITNPLSGNNEQLTGIWMELTKPQQIYSKISAENFRVGSWYNGHRGSISGWQKSKAFNTSWNGSMVSSADTSVNSQFIRSRVGMNRIQGILNFNLIGEMENSLSRSFQTDSLLPQSFSWYQLKASASTPDTLVAQAELSYTYREDFKPYQDAYEQVGVAQEVVLSGRVVDEKAGNLFSSVGYRIFNPNTEFFQDIGDNERTVLARLEYSNRLLNGLWQISGGYELGSGLEPDAEFYFVEVPAGQGVYTWVDYNGNGIMELDEFEIANFTDEARFIRINIPGSKLISVRNNAFSLRSNINPSILLKGSEGFSQQIARLSNQTSYRVQQKNRFDNFWQSANPFVENTNDTLITSMSANLRNSLAYNRTNRKFGVEYIYIQGINKSILANGYELRELQNHKAVVWKSLGNRLTLRSEGEQYNNVANSQYFVFRNYSILGYLGKQSFRYLSQKNHAVEVSYQWNQSSNELGAEEMASQTVSVQTDLVYASKGSLMAKCLFVSNQFSGNPQSAAGYDMLKGLQPGRNIVWEVSIKRRLSKLFELELGYNGRYLNDGKTIHSGSMQARALF